MTKIIIDRQKVFAHHGALPQEQAVGAYFYVSAELVMEGNPSALTDNLSDTVNYASVSQAITEEMAIRSDLLEHVAGRIQKRLLNEHPTALQITVRVMKENPPLGIQCEGAGVEVSYSRNENDMMLFS